LSHWYAIVDGAADPRLYDLIIGCRDYACLYSGDYDEDVRATLPYMVRMRNGEKFSEIWSAHESGKFWGILCKTDMELTSFRRHLRHFTTAQLPGGEVVMFRFWDPRVFSVYAEEGTLEEVGSFFKGIETVLCDLGSEGRKNYDWENSLKATKQR